MFATEISTKPYLQLDYFSPLPIPSQVWEELSMDFIGGLPKAQGMDTILVVVDRLTRYSHCIGLSHPYTVREVVALLKKS